MNVGMDAQHSQNSEVRIRSLGYEFKGHNKKFLGGKRVIDKFQTIAREVMTISELSQVTDRCFVTERFSGREIQNSKSLS
jgi:hypothetical protein